MKWCRFQAGNSTSYGLIEGDVVTTVEGDPFSGHKVTSMKHPLNKVKLLVPFVPGTFYCVGINYRDHIIKMAARRGAEPREEFGLGYLVARGEL